MPGTIALSLIPDGRQERERERDGRNKAPNTNRIHRIRRRHQQNDTKTKTHTKGLQEKRKGGRKRALAASWFPAPTSQHSNCSTTIYTGYAISILQKSKTISSRSKISSSSSSRRRSRSKISPGTFEIEGSGAVATSSGQAYLSGLASSTALRQ